MAGNEFTTWMHTDPHARSRETIWSEKFHKILSRLGAADDHSWDREIYLRCAGCHDPLAIGVRRLDAAFGSSSQTSSADLDRTAPDSDAADGSMPRISIHSMQPRGIGCESCHGPAEEWLDKHYQRGASPEQLSALGMNATKDLMVRGRVCAACHVGSAENDMNHDMIAAGHPALRFELASYHDRLPKHWPASAERLAIPDFQPKLWAAGQRASMDASLALLCGRTARAATDDPTSESVAVRPPWPELSEYSCLDCHQRLRTAVDSRLLRLGKVDLPATGLPDWNPWYSAELWNRGEPRPGDDSGQTAWNRLARRMGIFSEPSAHQILELVKLASKEQNDHSFQQSTAVDNSGTPFSSRELAAAILATAPRAEKWEEICQLFLAVQAAHRGCQDTLRQHIARNLIAPGEHRELDQAMSAWQAELNALRSSLAFAKNADVPRALLRHQPSEVPTASEHLSLVGRTMTLGEIRQRVVKLAEQIEKTLLSWEGELLEAPAEPRP